jgi:hypothetical protein
MKVGDAIKFKGSWATGERFGMLVSEAEDSFNGWWNILDCDGAMVIWPETQIEVVNESR